MEGVDDDGLDIVEPGWEESSELKFLAVDWNKDVEDDINLRSRFILTFIDDWLQRKNKRIINEPSTEVISFPESLQSDIPLSPIVGNILVLDKQKKSPPHLQTTTPRTRSQSKSKALKQHMV